MLNVIVVADFPLEKTGIMSNVVGLLSPIGAADFRLYSDQAISVGTIKAEPMPTCELSGQTIIFTHLEYKRLAVLVAAIPHATVHVGDWPGIYWNSVLKTGRWLKGIAAMLRFRYRLAKLSCKTKLVFVSREDTDAAIANGFTDSHYVPIGINPPSVQRRDTISLDQICFSGNFRYEPNRLAALALIKCLKNVSDVKLVFVGYYANDLREYDDGIELFDNVPSVVDFLATRRPVYVSLISIGAGAKNKILDAALAGCPIICTTASLDASVLDLPSLKVISDDGDVEKMYFEIVNKAAEWNETTEQVAEALARTRSWPAISSLMFSNVCVVSQRDSK
ncbi:hypothetical protein SRABI118_00500 [Massilia sp. Bi118]|uniref:glycosyltransferase n=1 Tax=Massilia sp. Bi118 TaxID=2822346 RepID=UPI001DE972E2|nr:glycosyltransferase [Massilia sp. Bi118]CAH0149789.1 hypothetical protein SRABI118_00500 [Massilia sp. Bi118]